MVVGYEGSDADAALSIARHISFADPLYLSREDVPAEAVDNERRIVEETARNEGGNKPEHIIAKIAENRLNKFFEEVVLLEQPLAKDPSKTVGKVAQEAGGNVVSFVRFRVGA